MFGKKQPRDRQPVVPASEESASLPHTPDRALCIQTLDAILGQNRAKGAVVKLYLENFKLINDTFGHAFGERLLEEVDAFLHTMQGAQTLRYSGVEFLILLDRCGYSDATGAIEEICERFEQTWHIEHMDYMCTMAMGMVFYPDYASNAEEAFRALEYAVAEAESKGQNHATIFDGTLAKKLARRRSIANQLLGFQSSPEMIEVRYRPTYSTASGRFTRAECALRLLSPDYGDIQAAEFLPIAEDSGVICSVNQYVIEQACGEIRRLLQRGAEFESIAVPVSPVQFLQERFVGEMRDRLEQYEIPAGKLGFEIMESVFVSAFSRVNMVMQELSGLGVELVLNEFGTGYSGINNILDLPVDVLKLERMFVWQLETNPRSGCVIEGLIRIAKGLGLKLIAEGVETENQVRLLREYGCEYEQGYFYSPTVEPEELERFLTEPRVNEKGCSE